jgi:hypothetical protein
LDCEAGLAFSGRRSAAKETFVILPEKFYGKALPVFSNIFSFAPLVCSGLGYFNF